jgi:cobalamin biosynthesis protein CobW
MTKIPVTIFTGFLGAGKTTLISNLLRQCQGSRIVVLVNEFGQVSIDGQALGKHEGRHVEVIPLTAPLIAYDGDEEFQAILKALLDRPARPDYLIIETSGLAVPTAVLERLSEPEFSEYFSIDATLDVVDTPLMLNQSLTAQAAGNDAFGQAAAEVFARQLQAADVVVLNKIDGLGDEQLMAAEAALRSYAPAVRFIELAQAGELNPRVALGLRLNQAVAATYAHELATVMAHGHVDGHRHSGMEAHEHGLETHTHIHEHDPGWMSFALTCKQGIEVSALRAAMQKLVAVEPVVRLKGMVHDHSGHEIVVHGVRDRIAVETAAGHSHDHHHHHHDHYDHGHEPQSEPGKVVFIGYHLSRERVTQRLCQFTGTIWE